MTPVLFLLLSPATTVNASAALAELNEQIRGTRFAIVDAARLWSLLELFGALESDLDPAAAFWSEAVPQKDERGNLVYPHKGTLTTYYENDDVDALGEGFTSAPRSRSEDATRYEGHVVEHIDSTTVNGDDASYYRIHKEWPAAADANSVLVAIQGLVFGLMAQSSGGTWQAMFSGFRVTRSATELGEPGPEGVHQDAAELTVVVLMGRQNVAHASGANRVWSLEQPFGKPDSDSLAHAEEEGRLLANHTLRERLEAIFLLDRHVKHEACPIWQADDAAGPAIRDVLTIEVRRPRRSLRKGPGEVAEEAPACDAQPKHMVGSVVEN